MIDAVRDYFNSRGFILADTPIFTPSACEGTTTLFPVQYFDDTTAYLTQSGQLYNEANAMALGRVYCFGPTFRAEKSKTRRHLTEFWMVEPEVAYATLDDVIELAEGLVVDVVARVLDRRAARAEGARARHDEARSASRRRSRASRTTTRSKLLQGQRACRSNGAATSAARTRRRSPSTSTARCASPAIRRAIKAFYFKPQDGRPEVSLSVDVLAPEGYGEIIGGGQRIDDYDLLLQRIEEHKLPREAFEWYLDLRRFGSVPHARLRHGHRARRLLDLRPRASARSHSVSAHAVQDLSVIGSSRLEAEVEVVTREPRTATE